MNKRTFCFVLALPPSGWQAFPPARSVVTQHYSLGRVDVFGGFPSSPSLPPQAPATRAAWKSHSTLWQFNIIGDYSPRHPPQRTKAIITIMFSLRKLPRNRCASPRARFQRIYGRLRAPQIPSPKAYCRELAPSLLAPALTSLRSPNATAAGSLRLAPIPQWGWARSALGRAARSALPPRFLVGGYARPMLRAPRSAPPSFLPPLRWAVGSASGMARLRLRHPLAPPSPSPRFDLPPCSRPRLILRGRMLSLIGLMLINGYARLFNVQGGGLS